MTPEVLCCFEDQDLDQVAAHMAQARVRRLPVLDRHRNVVGILSLGDARTVWAISKPGGPHSTRAAQPHIPKEGSRDP